MNCVIKKNSEIIRNKLESIGYSKKSNVLNDYIVTNYKTKEYSSIPIKLFDQYINKIKPLVCNNTDVLYEVCKFDDSTDKNQWFINHDNNKWIRTDKIDGYVRATIDEIVREYNGYIE